EHDRVDVVVLESGVEKRAVRRFPHQSGHVDVGTARRMARLADADHRDRAFHDHLRSRPSTKNTLYCRQCPCAACAIANFAPGTACVPARPLSCRNASPRRIRPVIISGCPAIGPPDGLIAGLVSPFGGKPIDSRRIISSTGLVASSSTTSTSL